MNILYLYHEYGNRRKKYGEIMKYLGNNVKGGFNSQVQLSQILFCYPVNFVRS